ncbi:MAG: Helix-turn-helix, AraC domain protein [Solirubrobacterales bacterium]|nr:Helix-turn-helix, AraC domain protein [Solirubrobacterales bacterium]
MHYASHDSPLGWWEMARADPDPRLRAHVTGYTGYVEQTTGFTRRRELPSGGATLIVSFGPAIDVAFPELGEPERRFGSFVAGLHDTYATTSSGRQHGMQVNLTPLGAFRVLGAPMSAFTNRVVALEDALGRPGALLAEMLYDAGGWTERFALLDAIIATRLAEAPRCSPDVAWAWRRLEATHGRVGIGALAGELGCSHRHLTVRFREQIGLPPKTLARVLRFHRVIGLTAREERPRWAEIAYECGYYDQAHLNRDFREFAGTTPTGFVERLLPDGGGVSGH